MRYSNIKEVNRSFEHQTKLTLEEGVAAIGGAIEDWDLEELRRLWKLSRNPEVRKLIEFSGKCLTAMDFAGDNGETAWHFYMEAEQLFSTLGTKWPLSARQAVHTKVLRELRRLYSEVCAHWDPPVREHTAMPPQLNYAD